MPPLNFTKPRFSQLYDENNNEYLPHRIAVGLSETVFMKHRAQNLNIKHKAISAVMYTIKIILRLVDSQTFPNEIPFF